MTSLTIIICTRNREFILVECLHSILRQVTSPNEYNVLVIDNDSTDGTAFLVNSLREKYDNLYYAFEPSIGLSHARNHGWKEAKTPWIGFVDDDAKVPEEFVERALWITSHYDFNCFGGTYYAWYKYGKKKWLPEGFGTKPAIRDSIGELPEGENLSGGVFFIKKELYLTTGGFNKALGMTDKIGYGEEDELQVRLKSLGAKIGYDPNLYIEHCVLPHKLKLSWHLKKAYSAGYFSQLASKPQTLGHIIYWLGRTSFAGVLIRFPVGIFRMAFIGEYYWQNMVLDIWVTPLNYFGKLVAKLGQTYSSFFCRSN